MAKIALSKGGYTPILKENTFSRWLSPLTMMISASSKWSLLLQAVKTYRKIQSHR